MRVHPSRVRRRERMREQGDADGYAGVRARWLDADYQAAWRAGRQRREREKA